MTVAQENSYRLPFPPAQEYVIAAWFVAIGGLILSLGAFWAVHHQLRSHQLLEFKWVAENRHRALSKEIDNKLEVVESVRDLFLVSEDVSREDFQVLARALLDRHPGIQALAWVPSVQIVDRQSFESQGSVSSSGIGAKRNSTFPILYIEPFEKNEYLMGFDYASEPSFAQLLERARDRGTMVVSERVRLGQNGADQFAFVAFLPVFRSNIPAELSEYNKDLIGYAVGYFHIDELAILATSVLEPRGVEYLIRDDSAIEERQFLGFYSSRLGPRRPSLPEDWQAWRQQRRPQLTQSFPVGDRTWSITYAPTEQFLSAEGFQQGPWVVLASGLLLTVLLTLYLLRVKQYVQVQAKMEHALREREERFRQMTDAIEEVFWIQTPDLSQVLYVSPAYEKIWGRSRESLYQDPLSFLQGVHPKDQVAVQSTLGNTPEEGSEQVFRVVRPDGSTRWVRSREFAVYNEQGEIYRIAGIREDITEIKQAEQALRKSEKDLRSLFYQSPDIIKTVDRSGQILSMNRSIPELSVEQAIGQDSSKLLPHEYRKRYGKLLKKVFQKAKSDHFQYATADSEWWDVRVVPIRGDEGVIEAMVVTSNFTEMRTLQEQAIRNARLASLGVLAASVAHEVNNPNSAIQFNASVLSRIADEALPIIERYREQNGTFLLGGMPVEKALTSVPRLLSGIKNSSLRIRKIVENLKHMSRHDSGDLSHKIDILEVLQAAISILRNQIQKHTDHFSLDLADNLPRIKGNDQQLEQVFINLIMNALQALPERSCAVRVRTFLEDTGENVIVEVSDEGKGIAENEIGKVKEPFFTTRKDSGGTGLGLSISDTIVCNHKGRMKFSSKSGAGTTVTVRLPVAPSSVKAA